MGLFNNLVTGVATSILANEQAKKDATARIKADVAVLHNLITLAGVGVKEDSLKTQATDMVTGRVEEICKLKAIAERKIADGRERQGRSREGQQRIRNLHQEAGGFAAPRPRAAEPRQLEGSLRILILFHI